jgi:hypothetical protein
VKRTALLLALSLASGLTACGGSGGSSIPAAHAAEPELIYVYESVIEVVWENGTQTSHYMHGPGTTPYSPDGTWRYVLRGASSNAIEFYFQYPMQRVRHANWRTVWVPQHSEMRLVATYRTPGVPCPCEQIEVSRITPTTTGPNISQVVDHPLDAPRPVDVDVTEAFNAAIATGQQTSLSWQVKTLGG